MATLLAQRYARKPANGEWGDASIFSSSIILAAAPIADVINFASLPAGCEVINVELINDALGAGVTLNCGYAFVDPTNGTAVPAYYQAAASKATAGKTSSVAHPITHNDPTDVTATIAGGAATGKVTAIITYRFVGTL